MATIKKQYSDNGRSHLLQTTVKTAPGDGENYVSASTVQAITTFLISWLEKLLQVSQFLSAREKEIREKNVAMGFLDLVMRDVWEVQKRRVKRLRLPAEVLTFYQLPLSGLVPNIGKDKDLLAMAANIIKGDAEAVLAGYDPILNPSIAEVQTALDAAEKELAEVAPADRNYDKAEEEVANLRPEADSLIADVVDELRFNLRKRDGASQRRIIQSYGVEINYTSGTEPVDDDETVE
jgi:hypothetical protein